MENFIMGSCGDQCVNFQMHMLEPVVLTEVKKNSIQAHYGIANIIPPANNLKKFNLLSPPFTAITNQIYYETKGHFCLGFSATKCPRVRDCFFQILGSAFYAPVGKE